MHSSNGHAARIDENNIVREVIVIPYMDDDDAKVTEFCNSIGLAGTWLDTSYIGARRANYAGVGFTYDEAHDAFIAPKPEGDWVLDQVTFNWVEVEDGVV
jgi:hypothetical protein